MKEIKAYIHDNRIADVIDALKHEGLCDADGAAGCRNLNVVAVQSLLKPLHAQEQHYSVELAEPVIRQSKLELICEDHQVDALVRIIRRTAATGGTRSGWIVVHDVAAMPID